MKRILILIIILLALMGCEYRSQADLAVQKQTERLQQEVNQQLGLPDIRNFQQKRVQKMAYEMADRADLICYAYLKSDYTGKLTFLGKCMGFGVPFSAQYTNPEKTVRDGDGGDHTIPQMDPNGLYMPQSSSATWLIMLDKNNKPKLVYIEPEIVVSPFELPFYE